MSKKDKNVITCRTCSLSYLMRNQSNPVIAGCKWTHEREVADTPRVCEHYKENKQPIVIHPIIFAR